MLTSVHLDTDALILAALPHGEHGAVARLLTPADGLVAGYVRGGRSRKLRPVLQPGNIVRAEFRARVDDQLPALTVELTRARAVLGLNRWHTVALEWLTALTAATLPERQAFPAMYTALAALLDGIDAGLGPLDVVAGVARYELRLLGELGFAPDLSECAATGARDDLEYVSPKSSRAVSRAAGLPYAAKLLPLPAFLLGRGGANWSGVVDALRLTMHFLERDVLAGGRARDALTARTRLAEMTRARAVDKEPDAAVRA